LKEAMTAAKIGYWAGQTDFQIKTVSAWIALAEKRDNEAVRMMHAAAEVEEASDKHPVTPGNVVPSRELLGEMLIALNQPAQALTEFERSLKRDPNRFRGIYGAARAAEASGNRQAARDYYAKLQILTADRDTERPELAQAKAFLAKQSSRLARIEINKGDIQDFRERGPGKGDILVFQCVAPQRDYTDQSLPATATLASSWKPPRIASSAGSLRIGIC
ncbi:MAG: tetratricopeptide repeat protein, partial [Candidatus Methylomirabilales bacterium]